MKRQKEVIIIDRQDFCRLAAPLENEMYNIAKAILLYDADCCDVIQNTLFKGYSRLHTLKDEKYFKTWLLRILINECRTMRRRQKRSFAGDGSLLDNLQAADMDYSELYSCIDCLKDSHRQVIILHYVNGYSIDEISELLKIPAGTVKSRLHHARGQLKELYGEVY